MTSGSTADAPAISALANDDEVVVGIRVLAHLGRALEKACETAGITISQYRILSFVALEAQRAGALANRASVSRPTLTVALDTLEQRGLVRRERVPGDRRGIRLDLTADGKAAVAAAEHALADKLRLLVQGEALDQLLAGLSVIGEGMRADYERRTTDS